MTIQEITRKADKLISDYFNKYHNEPNAIIMCENDIFILSTYHNLYVNHINEIDIHNCQFMGLKVIPVKHGEMEVFELL